ncbi:MAG TPA: hypothetical protein VD886_19890 [Herpetosiphonaceae bacterium]|nr:hypothetical protein [Herpetosiphonaceae bacterium]
MKQWWTRIVALTAALFLLSGCIASQTETKINADGSGTNTLKVGIEASALGFLKGAGGTEGEDPFQSAKDGTADLPPEWEATTADWKETLNDQEFEGVQITMKFKNIAMLNEQLAQMTEQNASDGSNPAGGTLQGLKVEETADGFVASGTATTADLAAGSESSGLGDSADALKSAVITWSVTMPGAIKEYEPKDIAKVSGNTITWTFPADRAETYNLRVVGSKSGGAGGSLPLILIAVGGLLLLGGLAFFVMNRRKAAPAPAFGQPGAYDPNAGYNPNAGYGQGQQGYGQQPGTYDPNAGYGQQGGYGQPGSQDPNDPNRR